MDSAIRCPLIATLRRASGFEPWRASADSLNSYLHQRQDAAKTVPALVSAQIQPISITEAIGR